MEPDPERTSYWAWQRFVKKSRNPSDVIAQPRHVARQRLVPVGGMREERCGDAGRRP